MKQINYRTRVTKALSNLAGAQASSLLECIDVRTSRVMAQ